MCVCDLLLTASYCISICLTHIPIHIDLYQQVLDPLQMNRSLESHFISNLSYTQRNTHKSAQNDHSSAHFWANGRFRCYHSNIASATRIQAHTQTYNTYMKKRIVGN